jgi:hypothetical protein
MSSVSVCVRMRANACECVRVCNLYNLYLALALVPSP